MWTVKHTCTIRILLIQQLFYHHHAIDKMHIIIRGLGEANLAVKSKYYIAKEENHG